MHIARLMFRYDALHERVDIKRWVVICLWVVGSIVWAAATMHAWNDFWTRLGAALLFVLVARALLASVWDARLASMIAALLGLYALGQRTPWQAVNVVAFLVMVLASEEYFKRRTKAVALGCGVFVGLLAAGMRGEVRLMLALFVGGMFGRVLWHALFERLSKLTLLIFAVKAGAASGVAVLLAFALHNHVHYPWAMTPTMPWPHIPFLAALIIVLLGLWGLLSAVLLKTPRSPRERGMRLYFAAYGLCAAGVVALLRAYSGRLFLPSVEGRLVARGLQQYSSELLIFLVAAMMLLVSGGIGRWQYKDSSFARRIRRGL